MNSFDEYKLIHSFVYPDEPFKEWFNEYNFINYYKEDYNWLIPVYNKIVNEELYKDSEEGIILFNIMYDKLGDGCIIEEVYQSIVDFIKWYNKQKEQI